MTFWDTKLFWFWLMAVNALLGVAMIFCRDWTGAAIAGVVTLGCAAMAAFRSE